MWRFYDLFSEDGYPWYSSLFTVGVLDYYFLAWLLLLQLYSCL